MMNRGRIWVGIAVAGIVFGVLGAVAQQDQGVALLEAKKFADAERALRDALKAEPWNTTARYYLGLSLLEQEKLNDALAEFRKASDEQNKAAQWTKPAIPTEYQIQIALARTLIGLKQYPEAWKCLESARIEESSSSEVYLYRGIYYAQQDKTQEAIKELERSVSLDPQSAYARQAGKLAAELRAGSRR
jgi:tetratricopeptide (TPR) repeat protein